MTRMTTPTIVSVIGAAVQLASAAAYFCIGFYGERRRRRVLDEHNAAIMKLGMDGAKEVHRLTVEHIGKMEKEVADYIAREDRRLTRLEAAVFGTPAPPVHEQGRVN